MYCPNNACVLGKDGAYHYLVDRLYPDAVCLDRVLDNLNTHTYHALVETFGKAEADGSTCVFITPPRMVVG